MAQFWCRSLDMIELSTSPHYELPEPGILPPHAPCEVFNLQCKLSWSWLIGSCFKQLTEVRFFHGCYHVVFSAFPDKRWIRFHITQVALHDALINCRPITVLARYRTWFTRDGVRSPILATVGRKLDQKSPRMGNPGCLQTLYRHHAPPWPESSCKIRAMN